jgi:O-antigen/teichoic acid export membrane protein
MQVGMQLGVLAVLARLVEPGAFGLVAAAYIAIDFCQLISEAGAASAVIHRATLDREFVGTAWVSSVAIALVFFALLAVSAAPVAEFLDMPELPPVLHSLGLVFVLMGAARVPEALLQRELRFRTLMKVNIGCQLLGYVIPAVLLALLGFGVWALVLGTLLQWALKSACLAALVQKDWGWRFSWQSLREMLNYGLGITKEKIWNYVVVQGDRFIVGKRLGPESLGQYHVMAVALLPSRYFGDVVDNVFFPVMARIREQPQRLISMWLNLVTNCFIFMFGVGVFLAANGRTIVEVAFGPNWVAAATAFQILCLGTGFIIVIRVSDSLNRAIGQVHKTAARKMINAVVFVPAVWMAARYELLGVCIALVVLQIFNAALQFELAWRGLGVPRELALPHILRVCQSMAIVLVLNGAIFFASDYWGIASRLQLFGSTVLHGVIALVLFWPLIQLWRSDFTNATRDLSA